MGGGKVKWLDVICDVSREVVTIILHAATHIISLINSYQKICLRFLNAVVVCVNKDFYINYWSVHLSIWRGGIGITEGGPLF